MFPRFVDQGLVYVVDGVAEGVAVPNECSCCHRISVQDLLLDVEASTIVIVV